MVKELEKSNDDALIEEQFNVIAGNVPALYLSVAFTSVCIVIFLWGRTAPTFCLLWTGAWCIGAAARIVRWRSLRRRAATLSIDDKRRELARSKVISVAVCLVHACIGVIIAQSPNVLAHAGVVLMIWGTTSGAVFYIFVLEDAPRIIVGITALLVSGVILASDDHTMVAFIPIVMIMTIATLDILRRAYDNFEALVRSRGQIAALQKESHELALRDVLTGMPNRRMFDLRLADCARSGKPFAVAVVDLDGFKPINDVYGHCIGDRFLIETARRFETQFQAAGVVARIGGDEFIALIENVDAAAAVAVATRLLESLEAPYVYGAIVAHMSGSCGVALGQGETEYERVYERADLALYEAKSRGRRQVVPFFDALEQSAQQSAVIEQGLAAAVSRDEIEVCYQPIVDLRTGALFGFEALARWRHPDFGPVSPMHFIALAEKTGLIAPLGRGLLRRAARAAANWPADVTLCFNLSALQLDGANTGETLLETLAAYDLSPLRFEVEVTETAVMTDVAAAQRTVGFLRAAGVRLALDDFGAGFSSFSQICDLDIDTLKIDKSLVDRIGEDQRSEDVVRAIVRMCESLDIACVAEGIETATQMLTLSTLGCRRGQGYYIAHPLSEAEAIEFIASRSDEKRRAS